MAKIRKRKPDRGGYAFLLPALIIYLSVIIAPLLYSVYISLHEWNGAGPMTFIGLRNYADLFTKDDVFRKAFGNNLLWILMTLLFTVTISLGLALLLNKRFRGKTIFRGVFYLPCVIAPIAIAIIWRWMYNTNHGFFNAVFSSLGINYAQQWLSNSNTSLFALFAAALWQMIGQPMILFLAGLQTVPHEVTEAATVDGANAVQRFFRITLPLLKETLVIVIATLVIDAVHVYDIVKGLTDGGPNNATQMLSTYMYTQTFRYANVGYGTAVVIVMVLMMLVVVVPYVSASAKED